MTQEDKTFSGNPQKIVDGGNVWEPQQKASLTSADVLTGFSLAGVALLLLAAPVISILTHTLAFSL